MANPCFKNGPVLVGVVYSLNGGSLSCCLLQDRPVWEELQARCGRSTLCAPALLSRAREQVEELQWQVEDLQQANNSLHQQLANSQAEINQLWQQLANAVSGGNKQQRCIGSPA